MPFKTKAQKIAASQRRFSIGKLEKISYAKFSDSKEKGVKIKAAKTDGHNHKTIEDLSYLKTDVLKITIASLLIIFLELALSLTPH